MRTSNLQSPGERFLSLCLSYSLDENWLSAADLNEEFPAAKLMTALEAAPELRAKVLVKAAGVHEKIAPKKSTGAASEDLQIALDEGICSPSTILELVTVDDHVRHLDKSEIWNLITKDQFWFQDGARPKARMLAMIRAGLDQDLIDIHRLIRAVTPEQLASDLPRDLIESALSSAIHAGLDGVAYEPEALLETLNLEAWIEHLPLSHFWDAVIKGEIGASAGLTSPSSGNAAGASGESRRGRKKRDGKETLAATPAPPAPSSNDAESEARSRAIESLRKIGRLPKVPQSLSSPVLLGLDSMYEELLQTETDEDRAEQIREAFPNPLMLDAALFALAENLDPRLTKEALSQRGADTNAIIQLILFEERRRAAQASKGSSSPPPSVTPPSVPPPSVSSLSPPVSGFPPLPPQARRASTPPPPLPAQSRKAR